MNFFKSSREEYARGREGERIWNDVAVLEDINREQKYKPQMVDKSSQIIDLEYIENGYNTCVLSIACLHDTEFYFPFQFIFIPLHSEVLEGLSAVLELPMPNRQYPTFLGLEDNF